MCDRAEDWVNIFTGSLCISIDVRGDILAIPEALEEAEDLRSLRDTARALKTKSLSDLLALDQGSMLRLNCEK